MKQFTRKGVKPSPSTQREIRKIQNSLNRLTYKLKLQTYKGCDSE